jgi:uncharacterized membrane protein
MLPRFEPACTRREETDSEHFRVVGLFLLPGGYFVRFAPLNLVGQAQEAHTMPHCTKCGVAMADGAGFCPSCGASQSASAAPPGAAATADSGLTENVAGMLCYILGWVTGLIFLLIDKRPFVRFHAAQSIAFNISIGAVWIVFWILTGIITAVTVAMHFPIGFLGFLLAPVLGLLFFVAWIFLMYKAYSGEKFKLPVIGNIVEGMVK